MESVWRVSKLSTESVSSRCELVMNCVHTADVTKQFLRVGGVLGIRLLPVVIGTFRDSSEQRCLYNMYIRRKLLSCSVRICTFVITITFKNAFTMKMMTIAMS